MPRTTVADLQIVTEDIKQELNNLSEDIYQRMEDMKKSMSSTFLTLTPQALNYDDIYQVKRNLNIDQWSSMSNLHKKIITHGGKDVRFFILYDSGYGQEWRMGRLKNETKYNSDNLFGIDVYSGNYNRCNITIYMDKSYDELMMPPFLGEENFGTHIVKHIDTEIEYTCHQQDFEKMIDEGYVVLIQPNYPDRYEIVHHKEIRLIPNSSAYYIDEWDELVDHSESDRISRIMDKKHC